MKGKFAVIKKSKRLFSMKATKRRTKPKPTPDKVEILRIGAAVTEITFRGDNADTKTYPKYDYTTEGTNNEQ